MDPKELYSLQIKFYDNDEVKAWNSLSKDTQSALIAADVKKPIGRKHKKKLLYKRECQKITERNKENVPDIKYRSFKTHHIDHIVPIHQGYKLGIDPEIIGSP